MIGVIATIKIQDGKAAEAEAVFKELIDQVRANEPGCVFYGLHKRAANEYVMLERYASKEALDAHGKTPYFQAAMPKLGGLLAGAPTIEYLEGLY